MEVYSLTVLSQSMSPNLQMNQTYVHTGALFFLFIQRIWKELARKAVITSNVEKTALNAQEFATNPELHLINLRSVESTVCRNKYFNGNNELTVGLRTQGTDANSKNNNIMKYYNIK